jgi:hypothetical protein
MDPKTTNPVGETATFEQKIAAFQAIATNPVAREQYAASRADVILPLIDEQSTIRAIFDQELLVPGADSRHDIMFDDVNMVFVLPAAGATPVVQFEGAEVHIDTFALTGGVEWAWKIAREGRFPVGQYATKLLKQKFILQEELAGWGVVKFHAASLPTKQVINAYDSDGSNVSANNKEFNIYTLNEVLTRADTLGKGGRKVTDIYMSPRRFGDLRNQVTNHALPPSMREAIWANGQGTNSQAEIRFHKVYNPRIIADNRAYAFTQKDGYRYGKMPIREKLFTRENPTSAAEWKFGVIGREELGFGVLDALGLMEIRF